MMPSSSPFVPLFKERVLSLLGGALGLVAALAWNDAVQALFRELFPVEAQGIAAKFAYAIVITAVVVYVLYKVERLLKQDEDRTGGDAAKQT